MSKIILMKYLELLGQINPKVKTARKFMFDISSILISTTMSSFTESFTENLPQVMPKLTPEFEFQSQL